MITWRLLIDIIIPYLNKSFLFVFVNRCLSRWYILAYFETIVDIIQNIIVSSKRYYCVVDIRSPV